MQRLYIVTRADLPPGAQGAQSQHALSEYAVRHPEKHREWHQSGKNLIWLATRDLDALEELMTTLEDHCGIECAAFFEPDFGDQLTAFAVGEEAARRLSSLPLALREQKQKAA
jgi:hypothetical protein